MPRDPSIDALPGRVFRRSAVPDPPVAIRAEGSTIWDADGKSYLDGAGGAIVVGVGHGRASVARVMAERPAGRARPWQPRSRPEPAWEERARRGRGRACRSTDLPSIR
jgi:4-aminobutyrate aminotransferase-like enzyme